VLLLVNGHDEHGVIRVQQLPREQQSTLHHGQPL
jgi:hypothetical protein